MSNIGEAFVTIRPDASTFANEAKAQVDQVFQNIKPDTGEFSDQVRRETEKLLNEITGQATKVTDATVARLREISGEVRAAQEQIGRLETLQGSGPTNAAQAGFQESMTRGLNEQRTAVENLVAEAKQLAAAQLGAASASDTHEAALRNLGGAVREATGTRGLQDFQRELDRIGERRSFGSGLLEAVGRFRIRFSQELQAAAQAAQAVSPQALQAFERSIGRSTVNLSGLTRGTTAAAPGLGAFAARLTLVGFAASAAFDGIRRITDAISVEGNEAFTAEGKTRNFFAEVLSARPVGAITQLFDSRQAEIASDITSRIKEMKAAQDPLVITSEKLLAVTDQGTDALGRYISGLVLLGSVSLTTAQALGLVAFQLQSQRDAAEAAALALDRENAAAEALANNAGPDVNLGMLPDSMAGLPTALDKPNIPPGIQAAIERERGQGDKLGLVEALRAADRAIDREIEAAKRVKGATKDQISAKVASLRATQNAIDDEIDSIVNPKDKAKRHFAFKLPDRFVAAQLAADASAALGDNLKVAQEIEAYLRNLLAHTKEGTARFREIQAALKVAQNDRQAAEAAIAADQAAGAAAEAARIAQIGAIAEARLGNARLKAALTEGIVDDRAAIQNQVNYFRAMEENARRAADAAGKGTQAWRDATQKMLGFQAQRLQAQAELKGLAASQGGFTLEQFFAEAVAEFKEFGSNIGGAGAVLAPQDARGRVAEIGLEKGAEKSPGLVAQAIANDQAARDEAMLDQATRQTGHLAQIERLLGGTTTDVTGTAAGIGIVVGVGAGPSAPAIARARLASRYQGGK